MKMIKGFVSYWLNAGGREGFLAGTILLSAFIFCNSAFSASTSERSLDPPALSGIQLSEGPLKENEIHDFFIFPLPVADTSDTELVRRIAVMTGISELKGIRLNTSLWTERSWISSAIEG